MKFDRVIVVGCGGTGSHLIDPLVRMLAFHDRGCGDILIVDGDEYESKNSERQIFNEAELGKNKALATQARLNPFEVTALPEFINGEKFSELVQNKGSLLVIASVDNHATRNAMIRVLENDGFEDFVFISPGNDYSHGQSVLWVRKNGKDRTVHPFEKYPGLKEPTDHIPGHSCQVEAVSTPQLITANASSALTVLLSVQAILDEKPLYEEVHFDCVRMKMAPQGAPVDMSEVKTEVEEVEEVSIFGGDSSLF